MLFKPIKYFNIYIFFTLVISFFGPAVYLNYDKLSVAVYMTLFLLVITGSYFIGITLKTHTHSSNQKAQKFNDKLLRLLKLSIKISLLLYLMQFFEIIIKNPKALLLSNVGTNYFDIQSMSNSYSIPILFRFLTGFFRNYSIVVGLYKYKELNNKYKKLLILGIVLNLWINGLGTGTQRVIGDTVIFTGIFLYLKFLGLSFTKKRKVLKWLLSIGSIFIIGMAYIQLLRFDYLNINLENYYARSSGQFYFDSDHIIFKLLGNRWGFGISIILANYLSAGYHGLSYALKLPFVWTYGVGSSYALSALIKRIFEVDVYSMTYLNRMELTFGRQGLASWNTIFPWLASDLSFIGAIIIFIPFGAIYAICWKEIIKYRNPVSLLMFATLTISLVFVPANNQLFNGIDNFIASFITIFYWLFNHRKYNYAQIDE